MNANEIGIKDNLKNVTYTLQGNTGLFFYNWNEKVILFYNQLIFKQINDNKKYLLKKHSTKN